MGAAVKIIAVILALLILFGMASAYSYQRVQVQVSGISFEGVRLANLTNMTVLKGLAVMGLPLLTNPTDLSNWLALALQLVDSVQLSFTVQVANNGIVPIFIPSENHQVYLNGIFAGYGNSTSGIFLVPSNFEFISFSQSIPSSNILTIAKSVIADGGVVDVVVTGYANVFGASVPFTVHKQLDLLRLLIDKVTFLLHQYGFR